MNETITIMGGRIVECLANGMRLGTLAGMFYYSRDSIKNYAHELYKDLDALDRRKSSGALSVARCIAAGLLQPKDLKPPGEQFTFTMQPDEHARLGFRDTYDQKGRLVTYPTTPSTPYTMPKARYSKPTPFVVEPPERNALFCWSTGRSTRVLSPLGSKGGYQD